MKDVSEQDSIVTSICNVKFWITWLEEVPLRWVVYPELFRSLHISVLCRGHACQNVHLSVQLFLLATSFCVCSYTVSHCVLTGVYLCANVCLSLSVFIPQPFVLAECPRPRRRNCWLSSPRTWCTCTRRQQIWGLCPGICMKPIWKTSPSPRSRPGPSSLGRPETTWWAALQNSTLLYVFSMVVESSVLLAWAKYTSLVCLLVITVTF